MIARIGTLAVGTRFVTLLTGRRGDVRLRQMSAGGVLVGLDGGSRILHPDVRVRVVETFH